VTAPFLPPNLLQSARHFPSLLSPLLFGMCGSEAPPMCHEHGSRDPFPWRGVCKMGHCVPPASGQNETMGPLLLGVAHPCPSVLPLPFPPFSCSALRCVGVLPLPLGHLLSSSAPSPPPPFRSGPFLAGPQPFLPLRDPTIEFGLNCSECRTCLRFHP